MTLPARELDWLIIMCDFKAKIDAMVVSASTGKAASSVPRSPVPPDTSIDRPENESITEMLMGEICESNYAKEQPLEDRESKLAEHHSSEPMFVQYAKALEKCTKTAAEFIRCASLLSEARQAYEKLRAASDEIRRTLDSDEEQVRALMDLAQEKAKVHVAAAEAVSGRKPPGASRPESFIVDKMTKFP
jgi:hypothetical protein